MLYFTVFYMYIYIHAHRSIYVYIYYMFKNILYKTSYAETSFGMSLFFSSDYLIEWDEGSVSYVCMYIYEYMFILEISDGNKQQIYLAQKLFRAFHQCAYNNLILF